MVEQRPFKALVEGSSPSQPRLQLLITEQMSNPRLTDEQRAELFEPLFQRTLSELDRLAGGDSPILWALRRKLAKELVYLERGCPQKRGALKRRKMKEQDGICPLCRKKLPVSGAELDRLNAFRGYTDVNTRLVHHGCHVADQKRKGYA